MAGKKEIKHTMTFDLLVTLMKGGGVVLCGKDDEPSVLLFLDKDERPMDLDDATDKLGFEWEQGF